jgi:GNAT superfamily N-acetyltransferase
MPNHRIVVVEDDDRVVQGLGVIQIWNWNKNALIIDIYVDDDSRHKGFGRTIIHGLTQVAREAGCIALVDYVPAHVEYINFYFRCGFKIIGYHSKFFYHKIRDKRDAIIFGLDL